MDKVVVNRKSRFLSLGIFFATLGIVIITLIPAVFPVLLLTTLGGIPNYSHVNPFEVGIWAWPLLVTDSIIFALVFLYFKNKLPSLVTNSFKFIFNFEISSRVTFIVIVILLGTFVTFTVEQIFTPEPWEDYAHYKNYIENSTLNDIINEEFGRHVKDLLIFSSFHLFGNEKVIPYIENIALLVLTYFLTTKITKKRFAGTVALVIVLQSSIFATYVASPSYENSWVLLYILSLYTIYKKWPISPISYLFSLFGKPLVAVFLPMTVFFIYDSNMSRNKKIRIAISYGIILVLMIVAFIFLNASQSIGIKNFDAHDMWQGFSAFSIEFRFDGLVLLFLLPLVIGLGLASRRGVEHADSIMALILGVLLLSPLLIALTLQTNQPYRFVPLIIFFAMGVGTLLSKKTSR